MLQDDPLEGLQSDPLLFESMVVRDVRVYAAALGGEISHYRDNTGLGADALVELPDGEWVNRPEFRGGSGDWVSSGLGGRL